MDEEFKLHYNAEAVRKKTENSIKVESFQNGLEQGISQGLEIAKNMLKENLDTAIISKITGLSKEEIESLL